MDKRFDYPLADASVSQCVGRELICLKSEAVIVGIENTFNNIGNQIAIFIFVDTDNLVGASKGRILDYEYNLTREPKRQKVSTDIVGMSVQMGTGLSTNFATYFDLENSKISETFHYVLAAKDGYVVCADYRNGAHIIIVQDIFDKEQYYKEYNLENVSPVTADFVVDGYFNTKGNINITYLSGEDYAETNYTIIMLPKGKAE